MSKRLSAQPKPPPRESIYTGATGTPLHSSATSFDRDAYVEESSSEEEDDYHPNPYHQQSNVALAPPITRPSKPTTSSVTQKLAGLQVVVTASGSDSDSDANQDYVLMCGCTGRCVCKAPPRPPPYSGSAANAGPVKGVASRHGTAHSAHSAHSGDRDARRRPPTTCKNDDVLSL
jgi:hypothetical protein